MIEVNHLTKRYGDHTAVSDLSFTIEKGQIYGFLGPNGAGKSTTMNIMTGCLAATGGEVKIGGFDIFEQAKEAKKLIGYLPEQPPVYLDRTPREYLHFVAEAKRLPKAQRAAEVERVMALTGTADVADRLIKHLSKGFRQRVGIAQALLGDPEIIILDEPTVGLDPIQIKEIRDLIISLKDQHTVILSSHILSEVQAVCQTILIIAHGKLVACDTPENLEKLFVGTTRVELVAESGREAVEYQLYSAVPGCRWECTEENGRTKALIEVGEEDPEDICRRLFSSFGKADIFVLSMNTIRANLEDVFMELTAAEDSEEAAEPGEAEKEAPEAGEEENA